MSAPKRQALRSLVCLFISSLLLTPPAGTCLGQVGARSSQPAAVITFPPDTVKVRRGSPVLRDIAAGEVHVYEITVATNQFVRVLVAQQGVSVRLAMSDSEGKKVAEVSTPNDLQDGLQVSVVTEAAGAYRLEVRSFEAKAPGSYKLELVELRPATTEDKSRVEAARLSTRGGDLLSRGTFDSIRQAIAKYEQALALWREVNDRAEVTNTLLRLGQGYSYLADNHKAIELYTLALNLLPDAGSVSVRIDTLNSLGSLYLDMGEYQRAFTFLRKALSLSHEAGDKSGVMHSLFYLGTAYRLAGEDDKALDYLGRALSLSREMGDLGTTSYILQSIGMIYISTDRKAEALEVLQDALALSRKLADKRGEAWGNNRLGDVYAARGEGRQALEYYTRALMLSQELGMRGVEAETLYDMGVVHAAAGEVRKSLDLFSEALSLSRAITDRRTEMKTLFEIARIKRNQGEMEESRQHIEAALSIVDSLRTKISDRKLRSSYFATIHQQYEFYVDVLMRLHRERPSEGFEVAAFEASERGRARSLLESLAEGQKEIRHGVDAELLRRERELQQQLNAKAERRIQLAGGKATAEELAAVERELTELTTEYQQVQGQIRASSPRYAALVEPAPLTLREVQQKVLDADTLLLEYALGEERSFVWAVTPDSIKSFELPARAEVERASRRVYELLTARNRQVKGETAEQWQARVRKAEAEYAEASAALGRMLLEPVAAELSRKRLVVVADGTLQYVPFAALPAPSRQGVGGRESYLPLVVDHEIVYLPSASLGSILQSEATRRERPTKTVAVIADPVLGKDDPRLSTSSRPGGGHQSQTRPTGYSLYEPPEWPASAGHQFPRLPSTRWEAEQITSLIPQSESMKAMGFAANRTVAMSPALSQYRIIHFATHALINNEHPELSGILLSLVDQQGLQQNGFLSINDIFNLELSADLVVLSACSTGLGKEVRGEGIVGLTRAFMHAGAPRVVVSLWNVDDRATADLMARFYEKMLKDKLEPAAALRAAQIEMWRKGSRHPFYWAGFVLQGVR